MVAVLCKHLGIACIEMAEDITGDTFLLAYETWSFRGIPENPVAWLYAVAKNKAVNYMKRQQLFNGKIAPHLKLAAPLTIETAIDLSEKNIADSQLQMLFAVCHPVISTEAQIGLALRILCGFGIGEIADAFVTSKETINKRLHRAKEKLRMEKVAIAFPGTAEMGARLEPVLRTLYLLFNEGYYSESRDVVLRNDLCLEAMRLTYQLQENAHTCQPGVSALLALMCFHASRFEARKDDNGAIILYQDQDESLWNQELITKGAYFLQQAATGKNISSYHLEASIAFWHTRKQDNPEKWENILQLYNHLLQVAYSPVAALNRTFALAKTAGYAAGIAAAEQLKLHGNHFYFTLLGELYSPTDPAKALQHFEKAMLLAKTNTDRSIIQQKISALAVA